VCYLSPNANVESQKVRLDFDLYFFDWCKKGIENSQEVWSDMTQVALDVYALLKDTGYDWDVSDVAPLEYFRESLEGSLSGVMMKVSISYDHAIDRCQVPTISDGEIPPSAGIPLDRNGTFIAEFVVDGTYPTGLSVDKDNGTVTHARFDNVQVEVIRAGLPLPGIDPLDGTDYWTKALTSQIVTFQNPLVAGEYIKIKTIPY
jgi:hypothetical protein